MVGLSVILENYRDVSATRTNPQVINKGSMIKPPFSPTNFISPNSCVFSRKSISDFNLCCDSWFLDRCFLCNKKLLSGKDIYMYKGDRAFCSEDCRCRQIFMDEEESINAKTGYTSREYNCSLSAMKPPQQVAGVATSSPSSSSSGGKGPRNRSNAFAY